MTQTLTRFEKYEADFQEFRARLADSGPAWLDEVRQRALSHFTEVGFPTARKGNEPWKYTSVAPIARETFGLALLDGQPSPTQAEVMRAAPWHEDWATIVFVNGRYSEALSSVPASDNGVRVESLGRAALSDGRVVQQHIAQYARVEDADGFVALNTAFLADGAFVHIPEGVTVETPIHLLFVSTDSGRPVVSHPRTLVVAGPNSKASIIESYVGLSGGQYFNNAVTELVMKDGAEIDHYRLLKESEEAFHVGVLRAHQGENAILRSKAFEKSAGLGRYDLYDKLDGAGGATYLHGLYVTSGAQHVDNYINIDHAKPYATSRLYYKGILTDKSKAVFGGTVWVRPGAIKTDAQQEDKNLVLSPNAEADSKPALFIYADDVKCGHGASAGNIDQNTVFYMRSRGIDLEEASRLLIYGFASEIIELVEVEELRSYLERVFLESLPAYKFEFE